MPSPVDSSLTLTSKAAHAAPGARVKRLARRLLAAGEGKQPPRLDRVVEGPRYHGEGCPEQSAILPTELRGAFVAHTETRLCCIDMLAQYEASCLLEAKALLVLERAKRGHLDARRTEHSSRHGHSDDHHPTTAGACCREPNGRALHGGGSSRAVVPARRRGTDIGRT